MPPTIRATTGDVTDAAMGVVMGAGAQVVAGRAVIAAAMTGLRGHSPTGHAPIARDPTGPIVPIDHPVRRANGVSMNRFSSFRFQFLSCLNRNGWRRWFGRSTIRAARIRSSIWPIFFCRNLLKNST